MFVPSADDLYAKNYNSISVFVVNVHTNVDKIHLNKLTRVMKHNLK